MDDHTVDSADKAITWHCLTWTTTGHRSLTLVQLHFYVSNRSYEIHFTETALTFIICTSFPISTPVMLTRETQVVYCVLQCSSCWRSNVINNWVYNVWFPETYLNRRVQPYMGIFNMWSVTYLGPNTVHPKKYAYGTCFVLLWCGVIMVPFTNTD